ncbi:Zinc finger BED domain-containing protein DAYSLEEPER, partial [Linum perenne]
MLTLLEGYGTGGATSSYNNSTTDDMGSEVDGFFKLSSLYILLRNKTELDVYLQDSIIDWKKSLDILIWWKQDECRYPNLASLAKDGLCIPITTIASESAFSMGGRDLRKWRSSLLHENVEALITTRNWLYGFP